ncbi:hypothetical protein [Archangium violaceum]|uniref:Uncharacterized protein n=1 Tax=Archangium violaceum Cb vi76 TaxID=1406225 RepID=A0A084T222_9BACT|nr:hypothetical protein [Archangium violaceum]KFA94757.1 hypothetical protein Q664_00865 [Archangium violaceum Cb vi76]
MTIRTFSSREVYRNQWMTVREDSIQRQDGSTGLYGVVLKPDFKDSATLSAYCLLRMQRRIPGL